MGLQTPCSEDTHPKTLRKGRLLGKWETEQAGAAEGAEAAGWYALWVVCKACLVVTRKSKEPGASSQPLTPILSTYIGTGCPQPPFNHSILPQGLSPSRGWEPLLWNARQGLQDGTAGQSHCSGSYPKPATYNL